MDVLLAVLLLLQEKTAEDSFNKIEETLANAKSIQVKFSCSFAPSKEGNAVKASASGTLLLKEGNKVKLESHLLWNGAVQDLTLVSDGIRRHIERKQGDQVIRPPASPTPASMGLHYVRTLTRVGLTPAQVLQYIFFADAARSKGAPLASTFTASEFTPGGDGIDKDAIKFNVQRDGADQTGNVVVRFDPKTFALRNLVVTFKGAEDITWVLTETYSEFTLNADIPDEKFKLPEEKK
jgi:outer membrane lipoprotein-sorting protein